MMPFAIWMFPKIVVPQIIHFNRVFHYKPSIAGYPYFWKHPFLSKMYTFHQITCAHVWGSQGWLGTPLQQKVGLDFRSHGCKGTCFLTANVENFTNRFVIFQGGHSRKPELYIVLHSCTILYIISPADSCRIAMNSEMLFVFGQSSLQMHSCALGCDKG